MSSVQQNVIKHKVGLLNLVAELGNVSCACKVMGFSRDTFYRYQTAVESGGVEALIGANRRKPNPKNRVEEIAESAVRSFWLRHNLESFKKRLSALESHVAQTPVKRWPRCRYRHLRESRKMTLRTAKSRPRILAISAARTLFTSARSRAQAEFINKLSYSKWVAAKLYTTKTPITAVDLLNDKVLPFFAEQGMGLIRILTDRGMEYCGKPESHGYRLYLALNDIEHTKTKVRHPQTNGICERFHKTILQEFYYRFSTMKIELLSYRISQHARVKYAA